MSGPLPEAEADRRAPADEREAGAPAAAPGCVLTSGSTGMSSSPRCASAAATCWRFHARVLRGRQVLQLAAAAGAEMGAGRLGARRLLEPLDRLADQTVAAASGDAHAQAIARQRKRHEDPGGTEPGHAVAARADRLDRDLMLSVARPSRGRRLLRDGRATG